MRLIEIADVKPGMIVDSPLYGPNGEILCKKGTELKEKYISKISDYSIPHIYITDEASEDITISNTISQEVKNEAYRNLKKLYTAIQSGQKSIQKEMQACLDSIDKITEDVIAERIELFDLFDIKMMNEYFYQHAVNVAIISLIIGKSLSLNELELYRLAVGAYFHDVGLMFIPKEVFDKTTTYTDNDIQVMRTHPEKGYRFAKDEFYLPMKSYLAILQHHERFDGTGYPHKKSGKDISSYGRIVAIADVYDALSSRRPYREIMSPALAYKSILQGAGTQFDPEYVKFFTTRVSPYPVGYTLKLPDKRTGVVIKNFNKTPFNPMVRIIKENDLLIANPYVITL